MSGQQSHNQHLHIQLFLHNNCLPACSETFPTFYGIAMCETNLKQLLPPASLQVPSDTMLYE